MTDFPFFGISICVTTQKEENNMWPYTNEENDWVSGDNR